MKRYRKDFSQCCWIVDFGGEKRMNEAVQIHKIISEKDGRTLRQKARARSDEERKETAVS